MPSSSSHVFVLFTVLGFLSLSIEAEINYSHIWCPSDTANFTSNSTYESNLNLLFSYLASNATNDLGFYNTTVGGQGPGTDVYGSFSCRGDVTPEKCQECVSTIARNGVPKDCAMRKSSVIWYDICMVRYSDTSFFGNVERSPMIYAWNTANITEPDRFMQLLGQTMNSLADLAADAPKKFATKEVSFTDFDLLYTLVQCTADLSSQSCYSCLRASISFLPNCCNGKQGGTVLVPSCDIRHEVYPFYEVQAATPPPAPSPPSPLLPPPPPGSVTRPDQGNNDQISPLTIVAIVVPIAIVLFLVGCFFLKRKTRKKYDAVQEQNGNMHEITTLESLQFDLATIEAATNRFSVNNKLGGGGFGEVYKVTVI